MSNKRSHLQMIQHIVTRMANNSFLIKGWSIVLISAIITLSNKNDQLHLLPIAFFPALVLWGLDGYFLRQERLFRKLYEKIATKEETEIDFSMNISAIINEVDSWIKVTFSKTLLVFHGTMLLSTICIGLLTYYLG